MPSGWTARWETSNVTYSVASTGMPSGPIGGKCLRILKSTSHHTGVSFDAVGSAADVEILVRWCRTSTLNGHWLWFGLATRGVAGTGITSGHVGFASHGAFGTASHVKWVSAASTNTANNSTMPFPSMNTWYWSRFRINGSSISLKRWLDGNPEPESYHLTVTDSDVPAAGWAGLVVSGAVSGVGDFYVDTFGVGTGGRAAE